MLTKLLKYDLKWVYKIVIIFYVLTLAFAGLYRFSNSISNGSNISNFLNGFLLGVSISLMINILINTFTRLIGRFVKNIYADESYLTHTLPVSKKEIYLSKVFTSLITILTGMIVIAIALFIMFYSKENMILLKDSLNIIADIYNSNVVLMLISMLLLIFFQVVFISLVAYLAISLAYRKSDYRIAKAVILGFILFLLGESALLGSIYLIGLFNEGIKNLFITNSMSANTFQFLILLGNVLYIILNIACVYIGNKIINKGVNVD